MSLERKENAAQSINMNLLMYWQHHPTKPTHTHPFSQGLPFSIDLAAEECCALCAIHLSSMDVLQQQTTGKTVGKSLWENKVNICAQEVTLRWVYLYVCNSIKISPSEVKRSELWLYLIQKYIMPWYVCTFQSKTEKAAQNVLSLIDIIF